MNEQTKKSTKRRQHEFSTSNASDHHHIFYQAKHWKKGALGRLRRFHYCRVRMERDPLHSEIHYRLRDVPAPHPVNAMKALEQLEYLEEYGAISNKDDIVKRLIVLIALFDVAEPQTTQALRQQLDIVREFRNKPS